MVASWDGHLSVVEKLVGVGEKQGLEERDTDGWSALHFAADSNHEEVVKFLASSGAKPNSKDNRGMTPLMHASSRGQLCAVQKLVEVGGDSGLKIYDRDRKTALHHALWKGGTRRWRRFYFAMVHRPTARTVTV
jgi:ankyrin repeat protein